MNKDQQNPNDKTLLGLKKRTPSNKPKEERILETVNRLVSRMMKGNAYEETPLPDLPENA